MTSSSSTPTRSSIHAFAASWARLRRLCVKELRECLRDRRTMVTLLVMPLLVYPILNIVFERFLLSSQIARTTQQIVIGVPDSRTAELLERLLTAGTAALAGQPGDAPKQPAMPLKELQSSSEPTVGCLVDPELDERLREKDVDLALTIRGSGDLAARDSKSAVPSTARVRISILAGSLAGERAAQFVRRRLTALNDQYIVERLRSLGDSGELPTRTEVRTVGDGAAAAISLAAIIPLVLILMTMTGAVYPAIDTTAGERERGTLEALIASPVPRMSLLFAKYVAVVVVSILTATANLVAMSVTLHSTGLATLVFGPQGLSVRVLGVTFMLLILFAFFFSAVLLAVTSFARSFKEAQAYLVPLILVSLGPSLICLAPGLTLGPSLAVTPLVNMVLLARDVFESRPSGLLWIVVVASTVLYSLAAISLAATIFGSDAVLYGSQSSWGETFRRPRDKRTYLSAHSAIWLLAVLLPAFLLLSRWILNRGLTQFLPLAVAQSAISFSLFGLVPAFVVWFQRADWASVFRIRVSTAGSLLGGIFLGLSVWPLLLGLSHWVGASHFGVEQLNAGQELIAQFRRVAWPAVVLLLAVVPAILEEWFFRGVVLSSLARESTARRAIVASAFLFGVFHVVSGTLAPARFLPSTLMGLILGWVCIRSRSLLPGVLLHAVHNAVLVTIAYVEPELASRGWIDLTPTKVAILLAASLLGCLLGVTLVVRSSESSRHAPP